MLEVEGQCGWWWLVTKERSQRERETVGQEVGGGSLGLKIWAMGLGVRWLYEPWAECQAN